MAVSTPATVAALAHQLLIYPVIDHACDSASYRENADPGSFLPLAAMQRFWEEYLGETPPAAAPLADLPKHHDLAGLPSAHLVTGRYDIDVLVALHDFDGLADLMLNKLAKIHGIRSLVPAIAIDVVKYEFDVAPIEAKDG